MKKNISTPYDDAYRTLMNDCNQLLIPLVNEVFGKNYAGDEKIIQHPNEHFINQQDGKSQKLTVTIPNASVIFLRSDKSTPDEMVIEMITPGGKVEFNVPVMKIKTYSLKEIL